MDDGDGDEDDEDSSICVTFTVCQAVCQALHRTPRNGAVTSPPPRVMDEEVAQVEPVMRAQRACGRQSPGSVHPAVPPSPAKRAPLANRPQNVS